MQEIIFSINQIFLYKYLEWRHFIVGFGLCMVIVENTINIDDDWPYPYSM